MSFSYQLLRLESGVIMIGLPVEISRYRVRFPFFSGTQQNCSLALWVTAKLFSVLLRVTGKLFSVLLRVTAKLFTVLLQVTAKLFPGENGLPQGDATGATRIAVRSTDDTASTTAMQEFPNRLCVYQQFHYRCRLRCVSRVRSHFLSFALATILKPYFFAEASPLFL